MVFSFIAMRAGLLRDPIAWLLAAGFLAGLGHLFLTPPFEGFDETAHYASLQIVADEHRIPIYGKDSLSRDVADYMRAAPRAYAPGPPFEQNGGLTYAEAFASPERIGAMRAAVDDAPLASRRYAPEGDPDWQAQHPPLAYVALSPVYLATKALDWKTHLFFIRLACFAAAMIGLAVGAVAARRHFPDRAAGAAAGLAIAAWPFYAPMFFPEMARLGNDSFCLFFMGLSWAVLLRLLNMPANAFAARLKTAAALGLLLGLGALTKAFFLPATAGICLYLFLRDFFAAKRAGLTLVKAGLKGAAAATILAGVFAALSGWWYLGKLLHEGSLSGGNDFIMLKEKGDFAALLAQNFSIPLFTRRILSLYLGFVWAGTWSFAKLPFHSVAILGLGFSAIILAWIYSLYKDRLWLRAEGAPLFIVGPVVLGLVYHVLTQIAAGPDGIITPGWYLHIFAVPLGLSIAIGARFLWLSLAGRAVVLGGLVFALFFGALAEFYQLTLFSGCSAKLGDDRAYHPLACFGDIGTMWSRLDIIANPWGGTAAFILAAGAFAAAIYVQRRFGRSLP